MNINQQVVLVTGASRGLGAQIARRFHEEGACVIINYYKNEAKAQQLVNDLGGDQVIALQADVRNAEEVKALCAQAKAHFGASITTIVNNALVDFSFNGDARPTLDDITWHAFQQQFEGSVQGALNTYQAVKDDMQQQQFGRIINIGTNLFQHPVVPYHDYNTSKAALLSMTRNMAYELGKYGIHANMVSGGLLYKTDASSATPDAVFDVIEQGTPLGKVTTPDDVAGAVLFFASPWSKGITGQNVIVDGGLVMQ
ncbi:3-oxoacyl-ACP reductase [Lysinibacillus alkalisoli]|uniref:3-oxoacyl-ACP reductase n=1 Tax=Lysinibacillus alkalisoli TaxID=1911548 RepID=A0A917G214_9BACI|nr:3-oxoacyl-ACP reductase [Lysinibacillus alkalisoli]GGG18908.1 3-oxoacyl-ACP reductase [Lysinibacillus alkalisoli]